MASAGSISSNISGISGLILRRSPFSPPQASHPCRAVGNGGHLICGRQLRPALVLDRTSPLLPAKIVVAGSRILLPPERRVSLVSG
ncbi:hypothetical protein HPP92_000500 [Vanilla planifolia]|uniref:Uncharacterized protein n=1 Tax=Vanilla planifolia TaxID=51239 RepID=A0A835RUK0_VANPL|nr:hypothetical protein HPP92_000500 [Vanilla planifolia]